MSFICDKIVSIETMGWEEHCLEEPKEVILC